MLLKKQLVNYRLIISNPFVLRYFFYELIINIHRIGTKLFYNVLNPNQVPF